MTRDFPTLATIALVAIALTLAFGDFGAAQQPSGNLGELTWSADEVALARHVTNEISFSTATDGVYIASVHMRMSRALGVSVATYIGSTYIRHTNPSRTDRPWIARLDGSLEAPLGWPESDVSWLARGRALWLRRLEEARENLSHPPRRCSGLYPATWGGSVDSERIARMTGPGGAYVVIHCPGAINTWLARRR